MSEYHNLLLRQLKRAGIAAEQSIPTEEQWRKILEFVSRAYREADQDRYLLERSQAISSRELMAAKEQAEQANTAKSKSLAAASHDLRQPLHALTLFVSALNGRIQRPDMRDRFPDVRRMVDNVSISLQALDTLFSALLDISRLDAGVIRPYIDDFCLEELFERLRHDYEPVTLQKGLIFDCPPADIFLLRSDKQLLERILRNYLSNALRYTEHGHISLSATPADGGVRISVSDSGKGIPRDKHREIFHEFYQLENPERDRGKGLGLGLAIVDRLARLLRHPIDVDSEPGRGSVFSVTVPLGAPLQEREPDPEFVLDAAEELLGLLVVVVEDERSVLEGMDALLREWGCEPMLAGSADDAVEQLRECGRIPDVVIADYRLREEKTGAQAIRRIQKECRAAIPAVIITGDTGPDRLREAEASGYQLLHKPVSSEQLYDFLHNIKLRIIDTSRRSQAAPS